jgi:hypothetical protein
MDNTAKDEIQLGQAPTDPKTIDIAGPQIPPTSQETAGKRSAAWSWALAGATSMSQSDMSSSMTSGREDNTRQTLATENNIRKIRAVTQDPSKAVPDLRKVMSAYELTDPSWFPESAVSQKFTESLDKNEAPNDWAYLVRQSPELASTIRLHANDILTKINIAQTRLDNVNDVLANKSSLASGWATARDKLLAPWLANLRETGAPAMTGTALQNIKEDLFARPTANYKDKLDQILDGMPPEQQKDLLEYIREHHSAADRFMQNFMSLGDIALVPGAPAGAKILKTMIMGAKAMEVRSPAIVARIAAGDLKGGAKEAATQIIMTEVGPMPGKVENKAPKAIQDFYDGLMEPWRQRTDHADRYGFFDAEFKNRLMQTSRAFQADWKNVLQNIQGVLRTDMEEATKVMLNGIDEKMRDEVYWRGPNQLVIGSHLIVDNLGNHYLVYRLGTHDGAFFKSAEEALAMREYYGFPDASAVLGSRDPGIFEASMGESSAWDERVKQLGAGHYLEVVRPMKETDDWVRDSLQLIKDNQMPEQGLMAILNILRNPSEYLPKNMDIARTQAVYGGNQLLEMLYDKSIALRAKGLRGKAWDDFEKVLEQSYTDIDPDDPDAVPGYFQPTIAGIESKYLNTIGRLPTEAETEAYWAVKDLYEADYTLRNMAKKIGMHRMGVEQVSFKMGRYQSRFFNAIKATKLPTGAVGVLDTRGISPTNMRAIQASEFGIKGHGKIQKAIDDGEMELWEVHAPETKPLTGEGPVKHNQLVRFVLTKARAPTKPIDPIQIQYRGGIHGIYQYDQYLATPRIEIDGLTKKAHYSGDTKLNPVHIRAQGDQAAKLYNNAIKARFAGLSDLERTLVAKLGIDFDNWDSKFKAQPARNGTHQPPLLNEHSVVYNVPAGKSIMDTEHGKAIRDKYTKKGKTYLVDMYKEGSPNLQHQVEFSGERDAHDFQELRNVGTYTNPVFQQEKAKRLSPMAAVTRGINRIARSVFLDPLKMSSVENWISEGLRKNAFSAGAKEIYGAPMAFFANPSYAKGIRPELLAQMKSSSWAIRSLNGIPSETEVWTHSVAQKLADSIYKYSPKTANLIPTWAIAGTRDPLRFFRSVAFHKSLGMFNPGMYSLHASTFSNAFLIAGPKHGTAGTAAAYFHITRGLNNHPEIRAAIDAKAAKSGWWRAGEFSEAAEGLEQSKFLHDQGTYALNPAIVANELVPSTTTKVLNAGLWPFRKGLEHMRIASWYMAYHEARHGDLLLEGGKLGKFSQKDWGSVLQRADTLAHNMTRASSSWLNTSPLTSTMFQFTTYFQRMSDLMLGKRLTGVEKLRLFAGNAILYGLPVTTGMVSIFPFDKYMRKEAIDNGYQVGENKAADLFMNGLPAMMAEAITGYQFGVAERFGPKAPFKPIFDNYVKDSSFWSIAFAAVGTSKTSAIKAFSPFAYALMSTLPGSTDENRWPLTVDDVVTGARELASVNAGFEALIGLRLNQWLTKSGRIVESDIPWWASIAMAGTGVRSMKQSDMYLKRELIDQQDALEKTAMNGYLEQFNKGIAALTEGNISQADDYFNRAQRYYPYMSVPVLHQAVRIGASSSVDEVSQVDQRYFDLRRQPMGNQ